MSAINGSATYTVRVSWAYESGDDEEDTYWGVAAYDYRQSHPNTACITLRIKLYISQANEG